MEPPLRRHRHYHRRLDHGPAAFNTNPHGKRLLDWNRQRCSFSSITFDGEDNSNSNSNSNASGNGTSNRNATTRKVRRENENQKYKRGRGQRAQSASNNSSSRSHVGVAVSAFATIHEAQDSMQDLLDRLVVIDHNSETTVRTLAGGHAYFDNDNGNVNDAWKERTSVFREAGEYFDALVRSVDKGVLSPSRKHGKDLSQLAECLLYVCSQQHPHANPTIENDNDNGNTAAAALDANEVMGAVQEVLRVLEVDWNLDVSHRHYEQAIVAACNCGDWKVASDLFEKQIDPNAGGSPVLLSVENPLALFAMTQRYQQEQQQQQQQQQIHNSESSIMEDDTIHRAPSMVAEHVMDAVQRLVMVSPQDQNTYVLAAGNALGHAGCWKELHEYRKSSFLSDQYGTPLLAAVIQACLLCDEHGAALSILVDEGILSPSILGSHHRKNNDDNDNQVDSISAPYQNDTNSNSNNNNNLEEEWQWGGARDRMDPLIRDLAMQVIGGASALMTNDVGSMGAGNNEDSKLAMELFRTSREEGITISREALLGVVEACERDKDWRGALSVLRTVLEEEEANLEHFTNSDKGNATKHYSMTTPWIVSSDRLSIAERDQPGGASNAVEGDKNRARTVLLDLGPVLASVMRNCNSSSNFGMSLFGLRLFQSQFFRSLSSTDNDYGSPEEEISQMLSKMNNNNNNNTHNHEEILVASMVALSGLRCHKNAMNLYETTMMTTTGEDESNAASLVYQYAVLNQKRHGTSVLGNPWLSAHHHINKLTTASDLVRAILRGEKKDNNAGTSSNGDLQLQERQREGTEEILCRAMNSCTNAHQPELSLYLLEWMDDSVFSQRDTTQTWLAHNNNNNNNNKSEDSIGVNDTIGLYGDSVTAETILALRWSKDLRGAIEMFEGILEKHAEDDLVRWRKTIVAGLTAMVASGRGNDAVKIFGVLDGDTRSTACYTTIGRHLSKVKDWKEIIELYRDATEEGYSSEELSLLAMLAVTSTKVDNRLRILRAIVDDCASGVGLDRKRWTMVKYWQLKRTLGFYHTRLLMWWNDEDRAPLDELNLAIKEFYNEKANGMRPKNDVVRAIFAGARIHTSLGLEAEGGYEKVPRSKDHWADLLGEILHTVDESTVRYDPNFVDSVVQAYKSLGKSKECLAYISDVLQVDGTRIRRVTLENVLEAAEAEKAFGMINDIEMLLSRGRMSETI